MIALLRDLHTSAQEEFIIHWGFVRAEQLRKKLWRQTELYRFYCQMWTSLLSIHYQPWMFDKPDRVSFHQKQHWRW